MNTINNYINDITQRIKGFLPAFINNVKYENYQELCLGFDNLSNTINNSDYSDIISLLNNYINIINTAYGNDSSNSNYLKPLSNYCKNTSSFNSEKLKIALDKLLSAKSDSSSNNYQRLPQLMKRVIFDLQSFDSSIPRYKIIITFINMIIDAVNLYNISSSNIAQIARIDNSKISLFDDSNEIPECPTLEERPSIICDEYPIVIDKKTYNYDIVIVILLIIIIIISVMYMNVRK